MRANFPRRYLGERWPRLIELADKICSSVDGKTHLEQRVRSLLFRTRRRGPSLLEGVEVGRGVGAWSPSQVEAGLEARLGAVVPYRLCALRRGEGAV